MDTAEINSAWYLLCSRLPDVSVFVIDTSGKKTHCHSRSYALCLESLYHDTPAGRPVGNACGLCTHSTLHSASAQISFSKKDLEQTACAYRSLLVWGKPD